MQLPSLLALGFSDSCNFNSTWVISKDGGGQKVETGSQKVKDRHIDFERESTGTGQNNQRSLLCHFNNFSAANH